MSDEGRKYDGGPEDLEALVKETWRAFEKRGLVDSYGSHQFKNQRHLVVNFINQIRRYNSGG